MTSKAHNTKAGHRKVGGSVGSPGQPRQQQSGMREQGGGDARDTEGRKGGSNEKNL